MTALRILSNDMTRKSDYRSARVELDFLVTDEEILTKWGAVVTGWWRCSCISRWTLEWHWCGRKYGKRRMRSRSRPTPIRRSTLFSIIARACLELILTTTLICWRQWQSFFVRRLSLIQFFLFSETRFPDGVVGKAHKGTMCSYDFSGGVNVVSSVDASSLKSQKWSMSSSKWNWFCSRREAI